MTLKILNPASERLNLEVRTLLPMEKSFLEYKISALNRGFLIPEDLISEIQKFIDRNMLLNDIKPGIKLDSKPVCPRCVKAHVLVKAREMCLDEKTISFLLSKIEGEIGHDGYYLDKGNLVKI